MLKELLGASAKTALPTLIFRRALASSPLLAAAGWFLFKTERGQKLRQSMTQKLQSFVGTKSQTTAA